LCLDTDDLWLKANSFVNNKMVIVLAGNFDYQFVNIRFKNNVSLMTNNLHLINDLNMNKILEFMEIYP
jgi:hypothetical protein